MDLPACQCSTNHTTKHDFQLTAPRLWLGTSGRSKSLLSVSLFYDSIVEPAFKLCTSAIVLRYNHHQPRCHYRLSSWASIKGTALRIAFSLSSLAHHTPLLRRLRSAALQLKARKKSKSRRYRRGSFSGFSTDLPRVLPHHHLCL